MPSRVQFSSRIHCGLEVKERTLLIFYELAENTHDFNREWFKLNGCKTALDGQKKAIVLFSWNLN